MRKSVLVVALILGIASVAAAGRSAPLPREQWNAQTHLWISRAMVAEAGWKAETDHIAIAYVLARRWRSVVKRYPSMRFIDVVRAYCSGLEPRLREPTARQRWLRSLSFDFTEPNSWPKRASWKRHLPLWKAALKRSNDWAQGKLRDPCRGRALHWGGVIDVPKEEMFPVACGETRNTFYGLKSDKEASYAKQERAAEPGS